MKTRDVAAYLAAGTAIGLFAVGTGYATYPAFNEPEIQIVTVDVQRNPFSQDEFPCYEDEVLGYVAGNADGVECIHVEDGVLGR